MQQSIELIVLAIPVIGLYRVKEGKEMLDKLQSYGIEKGQTSIKIGVLFGLAYQMMMVVAFFGLLFSNC